MKEEKTEIVKQVTKAYQENDFFGLLKLQISYIDDMKLTSRLLPTMC